MTILFIVNVFSEIQYNECNPDVEKEKYPPISIQPSSGRTRGFATIRVGLFPCYGDKLHSVIDIKIPSLHCTGTKSKF